VKRKLKVEELATRYKPATRPASIRLKGQWLRAAGFAPGATVELTVVSPGVIEIRICPPIQRDQTALAIMARIDAAMAKTAIKD
jgi:hypothetical protein